MVVAVTAIVATIAVPRFTNATVRYRLETAARRLIADLEAAQQEAIGSSSSRRVTIASQGYTISKLDTLGNRVTTGTVKLGLPPYSITSIVATVDGNAASDFDYDGYGKPSGVGVFVIKVGTDTRTVSTVAGTGKATVN